MINIGEQSGKIDEMMGKAAQVYEDELDEEIRVYLNGHRANSDGCSGGCRWWLGRRDPVTDLWSS